VPDDNVPDHDADERARLASAALARAKADARARGEAPPIGAIHADRLAGGDQRADRAAWTRRPRRPRRDDPQPLSAAIGGLLSDHGWKEQAAVGSVFSNWAQIVGPDLAAHTHPDGFAEGELVIAADSTAWATQVRLLASMLVRRLNSELGEGTVRRVKVRGPAGPRQRGGWRVPGSRGHGDTYG
jgi:predicted nucleic acid-binding Zn ribbon protein